MIRPTTQGDLSFEDFLENIGDDQKADLIDGVIYLASPENWGPNQLKGWLSTILIPFVEERRLGALAVDKFAFKLSDQTAPEPDLAFIHKDRMHLIREREGYLDGAPDLAVEIVSPDSGQRDYESKRRRYEEADTREYWIVDPIEQAAVFLVLGNNGFVEVFPLDHVYTSQVLPGLKLDVRWFWQRPLPPTLPIVPGLLGNRTR